MTEGAWHRVPNVPLVEWCPVFDAPALHPQERCQETHEWRSEASDSGSPSVGVPLASTEELSD